VGRWEVAKWVVRVEALAKVARSSLHCDIKGLQKSLQSEWMHLQRVVYDVGKSFTPIEAAITDTFLPSPFASALAIPPDLCSLTYLPSRIKESEYQTSPPLPPLATPYRKNTPPSSPMLYPQGEGWYINDHQNAMPSGRTDARLRNTTRHQASLDLRTPSMTPLNLQRTGRRKKTGGWLSIIPDIVNGTSLATLGTCSSRVRDEP